MTVKPTEAQAKVKVAYAGDPKFEPIKGTSMQYATNTADKVIELEGTYYLCLQGVWFMAPTPTGQWSTCMSVPKEIYTIPSSSPVYNVTYVTQTANPDGTVTSNYTAGYLGTFILGAATGAILADGSGYWWPPYCNGGYYYPYPATYCGAYYGGYGYHYGTPYYDYCHGSLWMAWELLMVLYGSATLGRWLQSLHRHCTLEVVRFPHLTAAEVQHRHIIHTPAPMRRRDKVRVRTLNGAARMSREETRALPWAITRRPMEQWRVPRFAGRKSGRFQHEVGKHAQPVKLPAAICMPDTMAMFTRIRGTVGRSTDNGSWNSVNKPQPNWQGAENSQQRTGKRIYQQRSSKTAQSIDEASSAIVC